MTRYRLSRLSSTQKSYLINGAAMFVWWLAFNPGFYSGDSFAVIQMARSGNISSEWTTIWAIFVKLLTLNGSHPEFATLFFSQVLSFSVTAFSHSLFKARVAIWSSFTLCVTPLVGAMGITLWHDIPMTAGFLLVAAGVLRFTKKEPYSFTFLTVGVILSGFRYNGVPTVLLMFALLIFVFKPKRIILVGLVLSISIGGLTSIMDSRLSPPDSTHSDGFINWMRYDLSCYAATYNDNDFFQSEFAGKATREFWKSSQACIWFNDSKAFFERPTYVTEKIPSAWLALALKEPVFIISTHMKRHEYLTPIPFFGPPRMPFIHTTIEFAGQGIAFSNVEISEKLRLYPRAWNYFSFIFGYSGLWLLLIFFFAWKMRSSVYLGLGILGLVLNASLFVFAIIPDARFTLYVLIAGQLIAIGEFTKYLDKRYRLGNRTSQKIEMNL
jgi:hypothetical protein